MSFIQWLGDWLRKVSTSVKSITAGTNSLTYTRHNNDSVTIPLTLESDLYVKKTGDTVTGNINSLYGVDGIETVNQFSGEMAVDDLWALRTGITGNPDPSGATGSTTTDNGFLEIATADNGTEPIYVSQYEGDHVLPDSQGIRFHHLVRRVTLLDEHGNTNFPGTVTAASFNGNATSANSATNANYATSAGTASKLGSVDVGSATQPIYLNDGVATACTYQLLKTVPADAKFTDTVYTHPTTSGNKHIPSGGSSGQILKWSADGTAVWGNDNNTTYGDATTSASGLMSASDKTKLDGVATGAEVNQNAFSNVKVGSTTVAADSKTDTLELVAGSNVTLTPDATNDKVTIAATDTVYTHPTTSGNKHIPSGGSSGQILRWSADGTATWGNDNNTTYPAFSTARYINAGGYVDAMVFYDNDAQSNRASVIRVTNGNGYHEVLLGVNNESNGAPNGFSVRNTNGTITASLPGKLTVNDIKIGTGNIGSATKPVYINAGTITEGTYELNKTVPANAKFTDTTYSVATSSANGLMSSADKTALDSVKDKKYAISTTGNISVANSTDTNISSYKFTTTGVYLVHYTLNFKKQSSTGVRQLMVSNTSGGGSIDQTAVFTLLPPSAGYCFVQLTRLEKITTANTTRYLVATQTSGAAMNVSGSITVARLGDA